MKDPEERDTSLAPRAAHGNRLRNAVKWYQNNGRLHTGDPIAMASDALDAYLTDRADHKDALLICDTWEIADALNRRLHDTLTTPGPSVTAARDQQIRVGDVIMSRSNDVIIDVRPGRAGDRVDQVRNGNRWRVAAIDPDTNRLAAERLTDKARAVFEADYLKQHVTLGYAATVHSAQGVTADSSYAILGEGASRAMLYVAMTRGRHNNEAFLYQKFSQEADHEHAKPVAGDAIHHLRRGNTHSAAYYFRQILHNDDRPRTTHAEAERTERGLLPEVVAEVIQRHQARRRARRTAWQAHVRTADHGATDMSRWPPPRRLAPPASTSTPAGWSCDLWHRLNIEHSRGATYSSSPTPALRRRPHQMVLGRDVAAAVDDIGPEQIADRCAERVHQPGERPQAEQRQPDHHVHLEIHGRRAIRSPRGCRIQIDRNHTDTVSR